MIARNVRLLEFGGAARYREAGMGTRAMTEYRCIDLFCGAGGLSLGFCEAGFRSVLAVDNDAPAIATYRANFDAEAMCSDIREVRAFPPAEIVFGGPPCQGFSRLGKQAKSVPRGLQNTLWQEFFRCVRAVNALAFLIENVPDIVKSTEYPEICAAVEAHGYSFTDAVLNAADYGVPQRRIRWFLIGSRVGTPRVPPPTHRRPGSRPRAEDQREDRPPWRTVRDAIGDLPLQPNDRNRHDRRNVKPISIERYKHIPPGGNRKSLPDHLSFPCWLNKRPDSGGSTDLMGRLVWNAPALTIRTEFRKPEKGCYLHPQAHRSLTVREGARLQTFPDTFAFVGSNLQASKQIGNAVPPRLAYHLALSLREHLDAALVGARRGGER